MSRILTESRDCLIRKIIMRKWCIRSGVCVCTTRLGFMHMEQYENQHASLIMIKWKVFILLLHLIWKPETTCETRIEASPPSQHSLCEPNCAHVRITKSIYYYEYRNSFLAVQIFGRVCVFWHWIRIIVSLYQDLQRSWPKMGDAFAIEPFPLSTTISSLNS